MEVRMTYENKLTIFEIGMATGGIIIYGLYFLGFPMI